MADKNGNLTKESIEKYIGKGNYGSSKNAFIPEAHKQSSMIIGQASKDKNGGYTDIYNQKDNSSYYLKLMKNPNRSFSQRLADGVRVVGNFLSPTEGTSDAGATLITFKKR